MLEDEWVASKLRLACEEQLKEAVRWAETCFGADLCIFCVFLAVCFFPQQLKALGSLPRQAPGLSGKVLRGFHQGSTRFCEGCGVVRALKRAPHAVGDVT